MQSKRLDPGKVGVNYENIADCGLRIAESGLRAPISSQIRNPKSEIRNGERGFTLIELLIVLAIIGLLVSIALPQYRTAQRKAKEAVLRENLARIRELLDQYKSDKGNYPQSLRTLVDEGYLRKMPMDPVTARDDTWEEIKEDLGTNPDPTAQPGVIDVKSTAQGQTLEGLSYHDL